MFAIPQLSPTALLQIVLLWFIGGEGGGALEMWRGYQARPKIHLIRVVFQDQALYARTSFRGAKTCKIGKKGCVFGHIDKFWKEHDRQIKKNACKNAYLGSFFIPEKYVIRVLFVSPWTSLITIRLPGAHERVYVRFMPLSHDKRVQLTNNQYVRAMPFCHWLASSRIMFLSQNL